MSAFGLQFQYAGLAAQGSTFLHYLKQHHATVSLSSTHPLDKKHMEDIIE
jgi:hypothetical protein